jgi:Fe-S-cluster containining protein
MRDVEEGRRPPVETLSQLHAAVDEQSATLHALHARRLQCRKGCSGCCVDDLAVFAVEAESIRRSYGEMLARGIPHREGACAFLDDTGACRIYAHRPYVCRTQGLPLRWIEERDGGPKELRDICPLNEAGDPVETLPADACWTIGPFEERLRHLQLAAGGRLTRVGLRDLFENGPTCETLFLNREAP